MASLVTQMMATQQPVNYGLLLSSIGFSGGAGDPWRGRGIRREEKGNSDFDTSVPWTGLQSGGIRDLNHALQAVSGYYTSQRNNKWWGRYFDKWLGQYGSRYGLTSADLTKTPEQLTSQQKFGIASMLDTRYRAIEDETAKPPEFLGGFLDKIIKFAGPAVGVLTGNPLLGALAGTLAGAPGKGFNLGAGLLGAAGGAAAGYFSPGLGGGSAAGGTGSASGVGNAVPGLSTGVTTPAGGAAIIGSGQAAPLTGLLGGAPLGASPLAVAGGATALPGVTALPTGGRLPGTNIIVGDQGPAIQAGPSRVVQGLNPGEGKPGLLEALGDLGEGLVSPSSVGRNVLSQIVQSALGGGGGGGGGGGPVSPGFFGGGSGAANIPMSQYSASDALAKWFLRSLQA